MRCQFRLEPFRAYRRGILVLNEMGKESFIGNLQSEFPFRSGLAHLKGVFPRERLGLKTKVLHDDRVAHLEFGAGHKHRRSKRRDHRFDALGTATLGRDAFGRFDDHQIGDKELNSVSVEINGGALVIALFDDTTTVLKMFDVLPHFRNRQGSSSLEPRIVLTARLERH
jgi:hypothetical protein